MPDTKQSRFLRRWKKNDSLTAKRLDGMVRQINETSRILSGPRQRDDDDGVANDETEELNLTFSEVSRTETTKNITDSNGDTFQVTVIDTVTMQNEDGKVMTLTFDNPA